MEPSDNWEWLVFPRVRTAVGHMAGVAGYGALAVAVFSVLDPLLWFSGLEWLGNAACRVADLLICLWFPVMAVLVLWCHVVLVAGRGFVLTRWACAFGVILSLPLLVGTLYSSVTQELFVEYQLDLPLYLSLIWLVSCLLNIPSMAAASLRLRLLLPVGFFLLVFCGLTLGIYELMLPYKAAKTMACLIFWQPLLRLQLYAPRIVSLPEEDVV